MFRSIALSAVAACAVLVATTAQAQDKPAPDKPASWWDTFSIGGHVDGGITFNSRAPSDGINFGQLFGDRANTALLNQAMLTVQRPIDPKLNAFDFGFKLQGMYGTDARYTHSLGIWDEAINDIGQIDIVEANLLFHLPFRAGGSVDFKLGVFPSPMSAEVISAPDNPLYSHSYIFQFGVPFKNTGALATVHVNDTLDLYLGLDTGANTSIGCCSIYTGDNNAAVSFQGGFGLNGLAGGGLSIVALTHMGPENANQPGVAAACNCDPNSAFRYYMDVVFNWALNDNWTLIADVNWVR
ncbi:MAG: outer membrane beta-barrel protein, partial [Rhodospirillaceae bacterium]